MKSTTGASPTYRPEIDGLRAVAIIPVLLFHASLPGFSGGYVGVDVFFVISGYLIARQILSDVSRGTFSLVEFWTRRARRIIPAVFVVVLACLIAGYILFFPNNYYDLGKSAIYQSLFISNIYFWLHTGYFDGPAETQPLLHMWSLSVEEQFYLCIPIFVITLSRMRPLWKVASVGTLLLGSFAISMWQVNVQPSASFFLLPSRLWELLLGCMVAKLETKGLSNAFKCKAWVVEMASAIGFAAIALAVSLFDSTTHFPGLAALLPCGGAALIIYSNSRGRTAVGRFLSFPLAVWVGLISYSLYLWHWPILSFARYASLDPLPQFEALALLVICVPISWCSYRWIETPFRRGAHFRRPIVVLSASGLALLSLLGLSFYVSDFTDGAKKRSAFQAMNFEEDLGKNWATKRHDLGQTIGTPNVDSLQIIRLGSVVNSRSKIMLLGDSFTTMYLDVFSRLSQQFSREVWYCEGQNAEINPQVLAAINTAGITDVVLAYSWVRANSFTGIPELQTHETPEELESIWEAQGRRFLKRTTADGTSELRESLSALVSEFSKRGIRTFIVDAPPRYLNSVPLRLSLLVQRGGDPTSYGSRLRDHQSQMRQFEDIFVELSRLPNVSILRPTDILCDKDGVCRTYSDGHALYFDHCHLSQFGAQLCEPIFAPVFR
jgi:peptidoglycan/LPS O-acetylase OafA/YrhL